LYSKAKAFSSDFVLVDIRTVFVIENACLPTCILVSDTV